MWVLTACALLLAWLAWAATRRCALGAISVPRSVPLRPGHVPLLGHLLQVFPAMPRLHDWLHEGAQAFGTRTWAFSLPCIPSFFVVTDPACLEHMLKRKMANYIKGRHFEANFGPVLGHGIFTSDGERWYFQRKLASHIFSVASFKRHVESTFGDKMEQLVAALAKAAAAGRPVDLHALTYSFTLDTFGTIGFGADIGCLSSEAKVPFAAAFDEAQIILNERFWSPAWPLSELLDGRRARLRRDVATVKRFALDLINARRAQLSSRCGVTADVTARITTKAASKQASEAAPDAASGTGPAAPAAPAGAGGGAAAAGGPRSRAPLSTAPAAASEDLLGLFLEATGPDGKPLGNAALIDALLNFIIAGRDTTAQALSWTFYLLLQHPEVEAKLLAEIGEVLGPAAIVHSSGAGGGAGPPVKPCYEQLRRLKYARAVFLETLRLYPSVPADVKFAVEADVLPDGTPIPRGAQVLYLPYTVNRLTSYWGADALEFRPERWLDMTAAPSPYNYLSFNAGPRLCLGQRLAELEGVYVLTGLLSRFSFRQAQPGAPVRYALSATLPMATGLQVLVTPRA